MNRDTARNLWLLGPLAVGILAAAPFWYPRTDDAGEVIVWRVTLFSWLSIASCLWAATLAGVSISTKARRRPLYCGVAVVLAVGSLVGLCFLQILGSLDWQLDRRAAGVGEYAILRTGWLDPNIAVARRMGDWRVAESYRVLAANESASWNATLWPRIVRPAGSKPTSLVVHNECVALLSASPARCVCAARADGRTLVDFDYSHPGSRQPRLALSPFFLVGPDEELDESDVTELASAMTAAAQSRGHRPEDLPTDAGLVEALESPNARVRAAAQRLVRAGGALDYPKATERIDR